MWYHTLGDKNMYEHYLELLKFKSYTAIQKASFDAFKKKRSLVGIAPTGTGKTLAYGIPIIHEVKATLLFPQVIVMLPTQELVSQVKAMLEILRPTLKISTLSFKNAHSNTLLDGHVIIGTPRKVRQAIFESYTLNTKYVSYVVFDEADMMFGEEFIEDIEPVATHLKDARFYLYSASLKPNMKPFLKTYFGAYVLVDASKEEKPNINHYAIEVSEDKRYEALKILLQTIQPYLGIVFVSKIETLEFIERLLKRDHINVEVISSSNGARERSQSIKKIQRLEVTWVLSSDVLARGIDLDLSHVIHYDLPRPLSLFMHRSGRTGRMKKSGEVITLYSSKDKQEMDKLMTQGINFKKANIKLTGMELRPKRKPKVAHAKAVRKDERVKPNYKKKRLLQRSVQK